MKPVIEYNRADIRQGDSQPLGTNPILKNNILFNDRVAKCHNCSKLGHIAKDCLLPPNKTITEVVMEPENTIDQTIEDEVFWNYPENDMAAGKEDA